MKTAGEVLDELMAHARPPRGAAIAIVERTPRYEGDTNWFTEMGATDMAANVRHKGKVAMLRRSDPIIDWSAVPQEEGRPKRIAKHLSELER